MQNNFIDLENACVCNDFRLATRVINEINGDRSFVQYVLNTPIQEDGTTLLHIACKYASSDIVKLFVENSENPYVFNIYGMSPIECACEVSNTNVLEYLERFYQPYLKNDNFKNELISISENNQDIINWANQIKFHIIASGDDEAPLPHHYDDYNGQCVELYGGPVGNIEFLNPVVEEDDLAIWFLPIGFCPLAFEV